MAEDEELYLERSPANLNQVNPDSDLGLGYTKFETDDGLYNVWVENRDSDRTDAEFPVTVVGPQFEVRSVEEYNDVAELSEDYESIVVAPTDYDIISELAAEAGRAVDYHQPSADLVKDKLDQEDRENLNFKLTADQEFGDILEANLHTNSVIGHMRLLYEDIDMSGSMNGNT